MLGLGKKGQSAYTTHFKDLDEASVMRKFWALCVGLLTLCGGIHADESLMLRDHFTKVQVGEFIVTSQNRTYTVMLVQERSDEALLIEEISVPEGRFPRNMPSWREWVSQGAPGHTSWVAYELQPYTGQMLEHYSYTKNGWCDIPEAENFLGTMLRLRLQPVDARHRRRVGPMGPGGQGDRRAFWNPRLVVDGETRPGVPFVAYKTAWPCDGGELSGKSIEVYLPEYEGDYPSYFPYWLQVSGVLGKAKMRIVDSGKGLRSPKPPMPRRPLAFLNDGRLDGNGLRLWLVTRPYYGDYRLLAFEHGGDVTPIPLEYSLQETDQPGTLLFQVHPQELANKLHPTKHYRFAVKSWKHPSNVAETRDPLRY